MKTKIITLAALFLATCYGASAQIRFEPIDPYNEYSVGAGVGMTKMYGDFNNSSAKLAYILSADKHLEGNRTILGINASYGELESTEAPNHWTSGMTSVNDYIALDAHVQVTAGWIFREPNNYLKKVLTGFYIGTGIGIMGNNLTTLSNKFHPSDVTTLDIYEKKSSVAAFIPVQAGFNFPVSKRIIINLNAQANYGLSDYIDGIKIQRYGVKDDYSDVYTVYSASLKFYIGHVKDKY